MLNTKEACIYSGVSKPTFLKHKVPHSKGARKSWKLYDTKILDDYFPNAPKILPKKTAKNNIPVSVDNIITIPEFVLNEEIQQQFDEVVDHLGDKYHAVHNGVIESLLLVQHTKRFYHKQVMDNPLSDWSKLLDQTIKQEISILKSLGLTV